MTHLVFRQSGALILFGTAMLASGCSKKDSDDVKDTTSATTSSASSSTTTATTTTPAPAPDSAASSGASDPAHYSDANIIAKEIAGDSAEVAIATFAKGKATSAAVKSYAALLVSDHSRGLTGARALATKAAITPQAPAGDTTAQATEHVMTRLQGIAKGAAFDTAFVNHEIEDHKQDIEDARAMTGAAKNADVKAFVQKSLPELQKHLDHAQKIAGGKS